MPYEGKQGQRSNWLSPCKAQCRLQIYPLSTGGPRDTSSDAPGVYAQCPQVSAQRVRVAGEEEARRVGIRSSAMKPWVPLFVEQVEMSHQAPEIASEPGGCYDGIRGQALTVRQEQPRPPRNSQPPQHPRPLLSSTRRSNRRRESGSARHGGPSSRGHGPDAAFRTPRGHRP